MTNGRGRRVACTVLASMLDSSPRIPRSAPARTVEWEETTFTKPMRSPFAPDGPTSEPIDVALEESALFEGIEDTIRCKPPQSLLRVLSEERDSGRLRAAARGDDRSIDLAKTVETPTFHEE